MVGNGGLPVTGPMNMKRVPVGDEGGAERATRRGNIKTWEKVD